MIDRTQIAALALQGLLSNPAHAGAPNGAFAREAVLHADALLAELSKLPPPRQQTESPKEGPPSGCSAGEAGDTTGAASPRAAEREGESGAKETAGATAVLQTAGNPASPVQVFDCEGRFPIDPPCPTVTSFDAATKGRFCLVHIAVDEGTRREFHRLHGDRNRPAAKARRIAEALG